MPANALIEIVFAVSDGTGDDAGGRARGAPDRARGSGGARTVREPLAPGGGTTYTSLAATAAVGSYLGARSAAGAGAAIGAGLASAGFRGRGGTAALAGLSRAEAEAAGLSFRTGQGASLPKKFQGAFRGKLQASVSKRGRFGDLKGTTLGREAGFTELGIESQLLAGRTVGFTAAAGSVAFAQTAARADPVARQRLARRLGQLRKRVARLERVGVGAAVRTGGGGGAGGAAAAGGAAVRGFGVKAALRIGGKIAGGLGALSIITNPSPFIGAIGAVLDAALFSNTVDTATEFYTGRKSEGGFAKGVKSVQDFFDGLRTWVVAFAKGFTGGIDAAKEFAIAQTALGRVMTGKEIASVRSAYDSIITQQTEAEMRGESRLANRSVKSGTEAFLRGSWFNPWN